jgi:hypothetical protein
MQKYRQRAVQQIIEYPGNEEYIPRLSENAKHLSLEAVNTEPPDASYFRKIKWIRYINQLVKNGTERLFDA